MNFRGGQLGGSVRGQLTEGQCFVKTHFNIHSNENGCGMEMQVQIRHLFHDIIMLSLHVLACSHMLQCTLLGIF